MKEHRKRGSDSGRAVCDDCYIAVKEHMGIVVQGNGDQVQFERALKLTSNMYEVLKNTKFEVPKFNLKVQHLAVEGIRATMRGRCLNNTAIYQNMIEI